MVEALNVKELAHKVEGDEILWLEHGHGILYQCCCACGIWHKIRLRKPTDEDKWIGLQFYLLDGDPDTENDGVYGLKNIITNLG